MRLSHEEISRRILEFISLIDPRNPPPLSTTFDNLLPEKPARLVKKLFPNPPENFTRPEKYHGRYRIGDQLVITQETADRRWLSITARELQVIEAYIITGSLQSSAKLLNIAYNTVKTHTKSIHSKLLTSDRQELIRFYLVVNQYPNLDHLFYPRGGQTE